MENTITPAVTTETTFCAACNQAVNNDIAFCNNCGYPLKGTEKEQQNFIAQLTINEIDLAEYQDKIRKGRNSLYYAAGAFALGSIIEISQSEDGSLKVAIAIITLIVIAIFVFLAVWTKTKPFAALVSGSVLFGIIVISSAIVDPVSIVKGIILKIVVIGCLVNGIRAAIDAEKIKNETHLS